MLLRILLCTPGSPRQEFIREALSRQTHVTIAEDNQELWTRIRDDEFDLVILNTSAFREDCLGSLRAIIAVSDGPDVVLLAHGDGTSASTYLAAGCRAVLDSEQADKDLVAALETLVSRASSERDRRVVPGGRIDRRLDAMGTRSPVIRRFQGATRRIAAGDSLVLIQGEPGAGKTWLGPVIHSESPRSSGPFHSLRCSGIRKDALESLLFGHAAGALPSSPTAARGVLEAAHQGTLFLERIDGAPLSVQTELLRYLDAGTYRRIGGRTWIHVDVRLLVSVKDNPEMHVENGTLHPALFRRIGLVSLTPPPLRNRPEDVPELALAAHHHWRARYGLAVEGFTSSAMEVLQQHHWPGNVSELWSVVERSLLLSHGDRIGIEDLPIDMVASPERQQGISYLAIEAPWLNNPVQLPTMRELREQSLSVVERAYLVELLKAVGGRVAEAARRAEVDPRSLYGRMRRYGLRKEDFKPIHRKPRERPNT